MVTHDDLEARRGLLRGDLQELLIRLRRRADAVLDRALEVPSVKAHLSTDGGVCPVCGAGLRFDPWSPHQHRCSRCDAVAVGDRHHGHWARMQHLWVAERAAHLAAVGVLADDEGCGRRARELLAAYHQLYFELPNRDNVLGPSHLFFSTYLESMWVLNYLASAQLLRVRGWLPPDEVEAVNAIADEAANLIGEFNEGMSNRQTWNAAALTAIAVWFGDDELATVSIQSPTGLLGHLTDGFGDDGMWFEGENYHLFAIRGLLTGLHWARSAGVDLLGNAELADHFGDALTAPCLTALPDLTFPARGDSRYGVALNHPAYLEIWEWGCAVLGEAAPPGLGPWLHALYRAPARPGAPYDAYLHDAGESARDRTGRSDLSWWMLLTMQPELPTDTVPWRPSSVLLGSQGVGVLRQHDRYVSLECGGRPGGHGHPDALHLTLHANGVHWLADPGAGSYVTRDLHWYRSARAHNAPRVDADQDDVGPRCVAFEDAGDWGWIQAESGSLRRSVLHGPEWLLDVVDRRAPGAGPCELPWHVDGDIRFASEGTWERAAELDDEFVTRVERFEPAVPGPLRLVAEKDRHPLTLLLLGGTLLRAECPGRPGEQQRRATLLVRGEGRLAVAIGFTREMTGLASEGEAILVTGGGETIAVTVGLGSATVQLADGDRTLAGTQPVPAKPAARLLGDRFVPPVAEGRRIDEPPALDGSFDGFDLSAPIELADELHYRRSELPYDPESFSAVAFVNWDEQALYLAIEVVKEDVILRAPNAAPLGLDNDADDIHADGIQVSLRRPSGLVESYLVRPDGSGGIWARPIPGSPGTLTRLAGGSIVTGSGYALTVALPAPGLEQLIDDPRIGFELVVNEMRSGRERRAGQLVWAGGGGWVYLRGDRLDPARLGVLELGA